MNTVTGIASDDDGNQASDDDDAAVVFTDEIPAIEVTKSADVTEVPETGGNVTYTITVDNVGETDVTLDTIIDNVFGDLDGVGTCAVPQTIAVGASYTCAFTEFVSGDPAAPHVNIATVTGTDEHGDPVTDADDETIGDTTTWRITVTNRGPSAATGVELTDVLGAELTYVTHSGDGAFDASTSVWTVGTIESGGTRTLDLTTTVEDAGVFTNVVEVTAADQTDSDSTPGDGQGDDHAEATVESVAVLASGIIGDLVWHDVNANGVVDGGEDGIAGVTVRLTNLDTGDVRDMATNSDGLYLFSGLDAGMYEVVSMGPGDGFALTTVGSFTIDLADGQSFLDADFGYAAVLPATGLEVLFFLRAGVALLGAGIATLLAARRRETLVLRAARIRLNLA